MQKSEKKKLPKVICYLGLLVISLAINRTFSLVKLVNILCKQFHP